MRIRASGAARAASAESDRQAALIKASDRARGKGPPEIAAKHTRFAREVRAVT